MQNENKQKANRVYYKSIGTFILPILILIVILLQLFWLKNIPFFVYIIAIVFPLIVGILQEKKSNKIKRLNLLIVLKYLVAIVVLLIFGLIAVRELVGEVDKRLVIGTVLNFFLVFMAVVLFAIEYRTWYRRKFLFDIPI